MFYRKAIVPLLVSILLVFPWHNLQAQGLNLDSFKNIGSNLSQATQSLGDSLKRDTGYSAEALAGAKTKITQALAATQMAKEALMAVSFSAKSLLDSIGQRFTNSTLPTPTSPSRATESSPAVRDEPVVPISQPVSTTPPVSIPNIVAPSSNLSVAARFAAFEAQIAQVRNLIGRQSDSNSRSTAAAITETRTIINENSFDTTTAHNWTALQTFSNASSTLFSAQYASTTLLCVGGDCRTSWSAGGASFAYPFTTLTGTSIQATSSVMNFNGGILTSASSTLASTTLTSLLSANATTTDLYVGNIASTTQVRANTGFIGFLTSVFGSFTNILATGSSTFQAFGGTSGTTTNFATVNLISSASTTLASTTATGLLVTGSASTSNFFTNNLLANGSSTFQKLFSTSATATSLYGTNLLMNGSSTIGNNTAGTGLTIFGGATTTGNFLALGSSTFQALFSTSATATNLFATNFLATASSSFQALFSTSATATNLFSTNFLANGSSTLQSATSTNFYASAALNIGPAMNFIGRATTTITVNDRAWVIATSTAAASYPLMSFNNSAGTSTIQFFGATTTGLTAGTGVGIPTGQFVLIGDGATPSGLNILKGGLCVDNDGWCTASTTGRISSVSSYLGGSDLAEMYQASEYVEPGDVVAIVSGISVAKATHDGKDKMMGVISTKPGIVLGTGPDAEGRSGDVPVALTGRVPVKVSAENGAIHAGDYLTLSSITGVGARATKAGTTIGQALEDYSGAGVGKILVFVKNSYYSGLSLDNFPGLTVSGVSTPEAMLVALKNGANTGSVISSDLTADRMLAAVEIITPKITAGLISAETIESPTITALSNRITTEISSLQVQINSTNSALTSLTDRVAALERASTTGFSLALVSEAVNNYMASTANWVVSKIEAQLIKAVDAIFTRLCLSDANGETCITRGELQNILNSTGQTGSSAPVVDTTPTPEPEPESTPNPDEEVEPEPEPEPEVAPEEVSAPEESTPPAETQTDDSANNG